MNKEARPIEELLKVFKIKTAVPQLYELAFTHSSFNADAGTNHHDYERLEFIGDSVIGFVVAELAFMHHKEMGQGMMTKMRSQLVQSKTLAELARRFRFGDYVRIGNSIKDRSTVNSDRILEDVFEAFMGAIYLDQGFGFAHYVVEKIFIDHVKGFEPDMITDYKSQLQEAMQAEHREAVQYVLVEERGPSHDKEFIVDVRFNDLTLGNGHGKTKKAAEQMAAKNALAKKVG